MAVAVDVEESLRAKFAVLLPHLDERQQRLCLGAEARSLGHGGVAAVARAAGVSRPTVAAGVMELEAGGEPLGRVRRAGGGRKRAAEVDRGLRPALLALVEPDMRGDPGSPLRWTTKSLRVLAAELTRQGHRCGPDTVAGLLRAEGFSLQANAKTIEGAQHPDRDAQFRYINEQARTHQDAGEPVISVDTKKKELVGPYRNGGREWRPEGAPIPVKTHDFPDEQLGKAIPYGVYDLAANAGWVSVGTDHDTAAFAAESIRRWWHGAGAAAYPRARRLLITADAGGSNSYRTRAWKTALAALAAETGLDITCCHFPPGTSKWNKIEHRLFAHIAMNWRGRPLTSHEVILNTIAATTTRTGLRVHAELDDGAYPTGIKISDQQMATLPITRHHWHGTWNYTLHPHTSPAPPTPAPPTPPTRASQATLSHPALTGLDTPTLHHLTSALTTSFGAWQEHQRHHARGGPRRRTATQHPSPRRKLDLTDHLLATLLHQRFGLPAHAIAPLFAAAPSTISYAIRLTRKLLTHHPTPTIQPAPTRLHTLSDLYHHAATTGITLPPHLNTPT